MTPSVPLPETVRLIVDDDPGSGAWNMGVDAALLESVLNNGGCVLRWYRWQDPTLSLGYFQSAGDPLIDERFSDLPLVRRLSGGGAILHDRELTYSCALDNSHPLASDPGRLYSSIHAAIVETLADIGITIAPRGTANRDLDGNFLCFSRGDANDLVLDGHKVLGSAQRRRRGAVLQHGSLLLQASNLAPEYPGILDLTDVPIDDRVISRLIAATAAILGRNTEIGPLTNTETDRVIEFARQPLRQATSAGSAGRGD